MTAVKATLVGLEKLDEAVRRAGLGSRKAARASVDETSRRIQQALRAEVDRIFSGGTARAGRGRSVAGAVRRKVYDNGSRGAAALVYSNFGRRDGGEFVDYLGPYLTGREIRPRRGRYLAVPLQRGRRNRSPEAFDDLRAVAIGGRLFLVRSTRTRTTFMFLLLPRVRISKRLRAARIARRELQAMAGRARRALGS